MTTSSTTVISSTIPSTPENLRLSRKISRAEIERSGGVSVTTMRAIEEGRPGVRVSSLRRAAAALGIDPVEYFAAFCRVAAESEPSPRR